MATTYSRSTSTTRSNGYEVMQASHTAVSIKDSIKRIKLIDAQASWQGDVAGSVRSLVVSAKRLQELLKQWSLGQATETQVSDAYVRFGTDFNATITAFKCHKIDLSDIYSVPGQLRVPLEVCLVNEPSPEILEEHMPEIRRALYKLFEGIQARKEAWKSAGGRASPYPSR